MRSSVKDWRSYAGIGTLAVALVASMSGHSFLVPTWVWWLAAVVAAYARCFSLEWRAHQRTASRVVPHMSLEETVQRIRETTQIFGADNSESMEVLSAFDSIREAALNGQIQVFGARNLEWRATRPARYSSIPRHPIPKEHWVDHCLDYHAFHSDFFGETQRIDGRDGDTFNIIWFNRHQVDAVWPDKMNHPKWKGIIGRLRPPKPQAQ